ncbi:hypothetical protein KC332_g18511 [Hortaea werneckii]|uniref:Integral membrane protein n=2 Tax=Hortaea werneckii TaxID=91943 RepID=A0A3M7I2Q8_HORWE|nr:hypothetical protein KC350_g17798 [Hortaea werneckii]OTA33887.1 hypothetical protein BTJ68_05777 [Hortaea werneckii EXF-2000]KAI6794273.1 hypothetical protein KC358_g17167 [Hortaea werneckii]KAI6894223.1 hypothetical protein KC348_g18518 [Hortaea werneckii]KAI6918616.1 hypothetical protein KC341_g17784 [Hortaea werneckii]
MGKAGRVVCIFTPWALTIASLICLALIEIAGWNKGQLTSYYFMKANFTGLDVSAGAGDSSNTLDYALQVAQQNGKLADFYNVYLWNYCSSDSSDNDVNYCSDRKSEYVFDPVEVWGLNATATEAASSTTTDSNAIESAISQVQENTEALEKEILGKSGKEALDAYKKVAKWMFIAYEISFWTTLATIVLGILAIFSRIGSLLTWFASIVSSIFTFAAVLTSTVLFSVLVGSLKAVLDPYGIKLALGEHALAVTWLSVAFSWAATFFWLFSICCCSGRSNPHHKSNKGGLWKAEPKGQGYGDWGNRGRGLQVQKTGGGYERVASPFVGGVDGDRVPLQQYPQQPAGHYRQQSGPFEPYRHG